MATVTKRSPKPAASGKKAVPKKVTPGSAERPFLRFYHSEALRTKTLSVLGTVEQASDPSKHREALGDLTVELTNAGLDYFFLKPLKVSKAGFLVEQSANLGMAGAKQVMGSVIRGIIGRMDGPQLLSVCGSIRDLMT